MLFPICSLRFVTICFVLFLYTLFTASGQDTDKQFERKVIVKGLSDPWNIIYGPDDQLWINEAKGYRVLKVNPADGKTDVLLDLNSAKTFPRYDTLNDSKDGKKPWPQGGLMGMALHPALLSGKPYVYLAYVYDFEGKESAGDGHDPKDGGFHFKTKIVRYTYEKDSNKLHDALTICDSISGSNDHNGGRLVISAVDGKEYLFYSIGDLGAGQFTNAGRANHAQDLRYYEGKILRFNTEPDQNGQTADQWIPKDNPFNSGLRNAVWSLGHRNPQGLATMTISGKEILYSSEHGPFSDDEINIIKKGRNYGHPLVIGYADGNYNGLAAGVTEKDSLPGIWNTAYPLIENEQLNAKKLKNYEDPVKSFNATENSKLKEVLKASRSGGEKKAEWQSIAPSGIAAYTSNLIPEWKNSLLITSLKQGKLIRLKLNAAGDKVTNEKEYFKAPVRYRDVAVSKDGKRIYLVTDNSEVTSGPTQEKPKDISDQGAIIEFTYVP
ncbi:hypothetical protein FEM33_05430 [Dyadobacter flavalbus]|uniref:Glucose/Sorbosone dehydrogenase domain-containing protein n=1 Tax=Dyadobacter flavalbus TaxID=2579942 RepID=A0A5M8QUX1_9BACT|nr:hypothetical protein FEM33_05430 [Dyadobacter flavalbus]